MISPSEHRRRGRVTVLGPYSLIAALVVAATLGPAAASDYKCNRVLVSVPACPVVPSKSMKRPFPGKKS
jgi:hypothetical protein